YTLTLFSPLTPETASSTLSEMYCEKLKFTPGSAAANSSATSSVSFAFVNPCGHSSKGFSGANSSTLLKPATSVPSSGRPSCDTTDTTWEWAFKMLRILPTWAADSDSEIDIGNVARIQKLPSSSFGMNSPPSSG